MPPVDLRSEAIRILDASSSQHRDELRKVVEQLLPIIVAIIGASVTVASTDFASARIIEAVRISLFVSTVLLGISFLVGVLFLILESNRFRSDKFAEALKKIDMADGANKSREWYLALAELSNRRSFALFNRQTLPPSYKKMFRDALQAEKNNIHAWKTVKNPERFYSPMDALLSEVSKYLFFLLFVSGGIGIFFFFSSMLFSHPVLNLPPKSIINSGGKG